MDSSFTYEQPAPNELLVAYSTDTITDTDVTPKFYKTLQRIANDVVNSIDNCVGAMVAPLEEGETLPVRAYTLKASPKLLDFVKMLETKFDIGFTGSKSVAYLDDPKFKDNLSVRAVKGTDGRPEIVLSESLHDLFRPVVPKYLSNQAQKLTGIKRVIAVPFFLDDEVVGNLFAATKNETFSEQDIRFLTALGHQAATAIQSQQRLAETQALERIILDLQTNITDEKQVLQIIVDAVVKKLGYVGAMVAPLEDGNALPVRAYALDASPTMLNFIRMLETKFDIGFTGSKSVAYLDDPKFKNNLSVKAVNGNKGHPEITESESLHDLFRPVVPRYLSNQAQKISGVKRVIAVPFFLNNEVVGNLFVGTRQKEFSEREIEIFRIFGQQAAVGIRNARLYHQVQSLLESEKTRRAGAEKLAQMASLVTNIRHDLRSELGKLLHYTNTAKKHAEKLTQEQGDLILKNLNKIMNKAETAIDLIKRLKQPTQPVEFNLLNINEPINVALQSVEIPETTKVIKNLPDDIYKVSATDDLMEVFRILFNNAIDAMQGAGSITISSRLVDDKWVEVSVSDTGPGIPEKIRGRIFEEHFTTKQSGGLGYGLFYAKTALRWMDGSIELAEYDEQQGANFIVRLPVAA